MKSLHNSEIDEQQKLMHDENITFRRSLGDSQERITRLLREMDSQSQAYSLQEHAAMTRFRSELFEAETAVTRAGATAGRSEAETDARASELSSEYRQGIERIRILHQSEYVETKRALDEQICAQKDAIEAIKKGRFD